MAQIQHLDLIHGSNSFTHNLSILPVIGKKMLCEATIVTYDKTDVDLNKQLELENRNQHRLRWNPYSTETNVGPVNNFNAYNYALILHKNCIISSKIFEFCAFFMGMFCDFCAF